MANQILQNAYQEITEDSKLITLATITTIFHSLILVLYVLYQAYNVITKIEGGSSIIELLKDYVLYLFGTGSATYGLIVVGIILLFGYYFFPPIAESSMIYYLSSPKKSGSISLAKGFLKFFPMFEFNGLISLFNLFVFLIAVSRFYVLGILENIFVVIILIIRLIIVLLIAVLLPYTKFILLLEGGEEGKDLSDAIKESMILSIKNFGTTIRFVVLNYLLYARFVLNIILILGVPLFILFIVIKLGIGKQEYIRYIIYISIIFVIGFSAYINGIIEAFFINYWYKVYQSIKETPEEKPSTEETETTPTS